ncbi:hypothetical protein CCHL11_03589 [Colletotrichum chlorophyti]|uniref:Uncharacterized protein n=1 Tax=Colletotrichum chlorophyti TaxID=708187 RepID=A0A1Q8RS77_9PEZI|nr:hypothetical protein CCHL11_03589 [Colletotrichum chlorophyti]
MQITASAALLVLSAFSPLASAAGCSRVNRPAAFSYTVTADGVPDVPGICGGLWDNLKRFSACRVSVPNCGGAGGDLEWRFNAGVGCNGGIVESAWWEATKSKYGSVNCP